MKASLSSLSKVSADVVFCGNLFMGAIRSLLANIFNGQLLKMLALAKTFTVAVTFKTNQGHREHVFYISKLIFLSFCQPREVGREDHTNS